MTAEKPDLVEGADGLRRCWWCGDDADYLAYHDHEWGVPLRDERALYELCCLEGFQAGLSWITILRKRPAFRRAFEGFVPERVADYGEADVERLLGDACIVRHRGKITAAVANANAVLDMRAAGTSLIEVVWSHAPAVPGTAPSKRADVPVATAAAEALASALRGWGVRFVGPTTAYALMQSAGLVDDHLVGCWRAGSRAADDRAGPGGVSRPSPATGR